MRSPTRNKNITIGIFGLIGFSTIGIIVVHAMTPEDYTGEMRSALAKSDAAFTEAEVFACKQIDRLSKDKGNHVALGLAKASFTKEFGDNADTVCSGEISPPPAAPVSTDSQESSAPADPSLFFGDETGNK